MSTLVSFIDLSPGDIVTDQFSDDFGITFTAPAGRVALDSQSPFVNALEGVDTFFPVEFPVSTLQASFSSPTHSRISIVVNHLVILTTMDEAGAVIDSTGVSGPKSSEDGSYFYGEFATGKGNIASFDISSRAGPFNLASITFDTAGVHHAPDFRLFISNSNVPGALGDTGFIELKVARLYGSSGPIKLSVSSVPAGLWTGPDVMFSGGDGDKTSAVSLAAVRSGIQPGDTLVISGSPESANAGTSVRTFSFPYSTPLQPPL